MTLVIETENRQELKKLKSRYYGKTLIEIAQAGNGNNLSYIIASSKKYEELLVNRDNQLNKEQQEFFIGSSASLVL